MLRRSLLLAFLLPVVLTAAFSQENGIRYITDFGDDIDMASFRDMLGFDYHKFEFKAESGLLVNVYIDEYLNDSLITSYNHFTANRSSPLFKSYAVPLDTAAFLLRMYTLEESDSIEVIQFRIGDLGLYRRLHINRKDFSYGWKSALSADNTGQKPEAGKKIPLLYYATAEQRNEGGATVDAFCFVQHPEQAASDREPGKDQAFFRDRDDPGAVVIAAAPFSGYSLPAF